jgi:general stress protein 26
LKSWAEFLAEEKSLAESGRKLLSGEGDSPIAFIATCTNNGTPHLAPVCPIFSGDHLYVSTGTKTPKRTDLEENGSYVLHAFLGNNDEEFQIAGKAFIVRDLEEINQVHSSIRFTFKPEDPIYRLELSRALWCFWENVGQPDTFPVRKRWHTS